MYEERPHTEDKSKWPTMYRRPLVTQIPFHHLMHVLVHSHTCAHRDFTATPWYIPLHVNGEPMLCYLDTHEDIIRVDQYSPVNVDTKPPKAQREPRNILKGIRHNEKLYLISGVQGWLNI